MTTPHVEHGFVIVRPNGKLMDKHLYLMREAADHMVGMLFPECTVKPARLVTSFRRTTAATLAIHSDIIVDQEKA